MQINYPYTYSAVYVTRKTKQNTKSFVLKRTYNVVQTTRFGGVNFSRVELVFKM